MRSLLIALLAPFAVAACEEGQQAAPTATEAAVHLTRAPMAMTLEGPTNLKAGDEIALKLVVHGRPGAVVPPAAIAWEIPAGVTMLDGDEIHQPVTVGETRLIHLRIDAVPTTPFTAVASINGSGFGLTSRAQYHFNNAAPKFVQPKLFRKHEG